MAGTENVPPGDPGSPPPRGSHSTPLEGFRITVRSISENTVLELTGELDLATAPILIARLDGLGGDRPLHLVADATALTFCDCSGLGAIVRAYHRAVATGGLTRVSSVLSCYADVAEALAAPSPDPPTLAPQAG
jgi:anti-anti-sigma factor